MSWKLIKREPHPKIPTVVIEYYPHRIMWRSIITGRFIKKLVKVVCQARMDYDKPGHQLYIRGLRTKIVKPDEAEEVEKAFTEELAVWVRNEFGDWILSLTDIDCWWEEADAPEGTEKEELTWHH